MPARRDTIGSIAKAPNHHTWWRYLRHQCCLSSTDDELPSANYGILEASGRLRGFWDLFRYLGIRSDFDLYAFGRSSRTTIPSANTCTNPLHYTASIKRSVSITGSSRPIDRPTSKHGIYFSGKELLKVTYIHASSSSIPDTTTMPKR